MERVEEDMGKGCRMCWCEMICCCKMCRHESVDTKDDEHENSIESSKEPTAEMDKIQEQISESGMNGAETTKAAGTNIVPYDESTTELVVVKVAGATET